MYYHCNTLPTWPLTKDNLQQVYSVGLLEQVDLIKLLLEALLLLLDLAGGLLNPKNVNWSYHWKHQSVANEHGHDVGACHRARVGWLKAL